MKNKQRGYLEGMFESIMLMFFLSLLVVFGLGFALGYWVWG